MRSSLQRFEAVLQLFDTWGWRRAREAHRFFLYAPPGPEGESGFTIVVPRDTNARDFDRSLDNCIDALASFYGTPFSSVEALLLPASEVVSLRLQGEGFSGGAAPFPQFERTLEHLKRTISRAASLVLTDDPLDQRIPQSARSFLGECWFLQTARGSFVTRVALPTTGIFGTSQYSLFAHPREKSEVATALRQVAELVGRRVLSGDDEVFTEPGFAAIRSSVSVGMLEELGRLLRGSQAERLDLSFNRRGDESVIDMPDLSETRLARLDEFVGFVRDQFHEIMDLDVIGRVFEVRRTRRGASRSFVGLEATIDGRTEYVTFKIEASSLSIMLEHFGSRLPIRVRGRARRLRTQIRIESDFQYEE